MSNWLIINGIANHVSKKLVGRLISGIWSIFDAESGRELPTLDDLTELGGGLVMSNWEEFPMVVTALVTNPTKANSPVWDKAFWRRVGQNMEILYTYYHSDNTGATAGSGASGYFFSLPVGYHADSNIIRTATSGFSVGVCGSAGVISDAEYGFGYVQFSGYDDRMQISYTNPTQNRKVGPSDTPWNATVFRVSFSASFPCLEFA